ncbi:unnamed protein product [Pedinophyceae sp. YPF-701]|nr:unnamed protein product [Pedinophyceae sp. YPF-701]
MCDANVERVLVDALLRAQIPGQEVSKRRTVETRECTEAADLRLRHVLQDGGGLVFEGGPFIAQLSCRTRVDGVVLCGPPFRRKFLVLVQERHLERLHAVAAVGVLAPAALPIRTDHGAAIPEPWRLRRNVIVVYVVRGCVASVPTAVWLWVLAVRAACCLRLRQSGTHVLAAFVVFVAGCAARKVLDTLGVVQGVLLRLHPAPCTLEGTGLIDSLALAAAAVMEVLVELVVVQERL